MNDEESTGAAKGQRRARDHALNVASDLFYANGARAVGMEQIVETSRIAKTTIYRHFPTKDSLIQAFLEKEDAEFWEQWDAIVNAQTTDASRLDALCIWVGNRVLREGYRGCPQLNMAAEFANPAHPARIIARRHKAEMHRRLEAICHGIGVDPPAETAMQIALLFDGAFASDGRLGELHAPLLLVRAVRRLISVE